MPQLTWEGHQARPNWGRNARRSGPNVTLEPGGVRESKLTRPNAQNRTDDCMGQRRSTLSSRSTSAC
jgi:hypothetical protein